MKLSLLACALAVLSVSRARGASLDPPPGRWARCVAAFEAARRETLADYPYIGDDPVQVTEHGVKWSFETGDCMHHTGGELELAPTERGDRGWHRRDSKYGYTAERRRHGLRGTITYYDRDESESMSDVFGLDDVLYAAFSSAIDRCLAAAP